MKKIYLSLLLVACFFSSVFGTGEFLGTWAVPNGPMDIAIDSSGNKYVCNNWEIMIKYNSSDVLVSSWNVVGSGNGVAVDSSYVYNGQQRGPSAGNFSQVVSYSLSGTTTTTWGTTPGSGAGQFNGPYNGLALDSTYIYVTDTGNNRIQKLNKNGTFDTGWGTGLDIPQGIAVDSNYVYVCNTGNNAVMKYNKTGTAQTFSVAGDSIAVTNPIDVVVDSSGRIYVLSATVTDVKVIVYDPNTGSSLGQWGSVGTATGEFNLTDTTTTVEGGLGIDSSDRIYVADFANNRIQFFQGYTTGNTYSISGYVRDVTATGLANVTVVLSGSANSNTATDNSGYYIFTSLTSGAYTITSKKNGYSFSPPNRPFSSLAANQTAQDFTGTSLLNQYVTQWAVGTSTDNGPIDVAVDSSENIFVCDYWDQLLRFDSSKVIITSWTSPANAYPYELQADNSYVYVCQTDTMRKYSKDGATVVTVWGTTRGSGNEQFDRARDLDIDGSYIYVLDAFTNNRVQILTPAGGFYGRWSYTGLTQPEALAVDSDYVYIGATWDNVVKKYAKLTGVEAAGFTAPAIIRPKDLETDNNGHLYVLQSSHVVVLDAATGTQLAKFGEAGTGNSQFNNASGIGVDSNGNLYVSDYGNARVQVFTAYSDYYSISGYVKNASSAALSGVTVTLSGAGSGSYTTGSDGYYIFVNLSTGTYTVAPTKTNWSFSSWTGSFSGNVTQNFFGTSTVQLYTLTGYTRDGTGAAIGSVAIALTGPENINTVSGADGSYSIPDLPSGTYNVTATKTNWSFSAWSAASITSNATHDFTGTALVTFYSISGYIRTASSVAINAVTLTLAGAEASSTTTNSNGLYTFSNLPAGGYTITPAKTSYSFSPAIWTGTVSNADLTQNFTGTAQA